MPYHKFSHSLGLEVSVDKSCIYFAGVTEEEKSLLAELINMSIGHLPFKYLGVPLSSKKLNFTQCKPLVENITERAQGWMANIVSYDGRLQLIRSILSSMQNYLGHIFPLSKKLIKAVEGVCRKFLWDGAILP